MTRHGKLQSAKIAAIKTTNTILRDRFGVEIKKCVTATVNKSGLIGMVDQFSDDKITGWVSTLREDSPVQVTLCINGNPIHKTWTNVESSYKTWGKVRSFYIGIRGIWEYCKISDQITVQIGSHPLPINEVGAYKCPRENGPKTLNELRGLLSNEYVINRAGDVQLSKKLDVEWQKKMIGLYTEISEVLEEKYKITPFLIYGSLLGQVREGGFIGHDDDLDIAYLSKLTDGPEAATELVSIARLLKESGFNIDLRTEAIHIHDKEDPSIRIDLFHLFFNEKGYLSFAFGIAGTSNFTRNDWRGTAKSTFAGHTVTIPENAERLVEHIYGSTWRTPIAGFNWKHARTRQAKSGKVSRETIDAFNQ